MKVLTKTTGFGVPQVLEGPHALSWAYMLDLIYADAYHRQVGSLRFMVGNPDLTDPISWRADVTTTMMDGPLTALAKLVTRVTEGSEDAADVLYTVEYGLLSKRHLRQHNPTAPPGRTLVKQYSVFTWKARYLGIPIRLASLLHQPHTFDMFMQRMRRTFLSDGPVPAYYHLKIWNRPTT